MIARYFAVAALVVGLIMPTARAADAGNSIDNLEFSQQGALTLVKVTLRNALDRPPSSFSTSNPYRLAFDFPATTSNLGATVKQAGLGILQSAAVVQGEARTRLVLNLSSAAQHTVSLDGNVFYVSLSGSNLMAAPTASASTAFGQAKEGSLAPAAPLVTNVDFQASSVDLATIRIDLTDPSALLDVKQQGANLVLYFSNTEISDRLEKRLDVRDFGTPVTTLASARSGRGVQITLVNRGEWDYSVRQLDTAVLLEVRRLKTDPNSLASAKQLQGKVVSFNFTQPVPIGQMIGIFQDISGLNFMVMPGVTGEIQSLKMENTPVTVAIDVISRMYGLAFRRYGDIVVVGKAEDLAKYDKEERERAAALEGSEPIAQESIRIRYRPATEIMQALLGVTGTAGATGTSSTSPVSSGTAQTTTAGQTGAVSTAAALPAGVKSLISPRGSIALDPVTNTLFIEETKAQLDKIRDRIAVLDRPIRQVMIEARLVEVADTFFSSLGVKLGGKINYSIGGTSSNANFSTGFAASSGSTSTASPATLAFSLFNPSQTNIINLELSAVESDAKSKTIASPKILSRDMQKATLMYGQQIPYATVSNSGTQTTFVDAVISLDVTPQIQQDGRIFMKVIVTMDSVDTSLSTSAGYPINKRQLTTQLVVENGGTVVLGGMYKQVDSNTVERIPLLGDLPYVGFLFKNKTENKTRNELLVFITPRVVSEDLVLQ